MLLYSSKDIYAVYHPGESDYLLLTFGYNGMKADDESFWAKGFCSKAKISAVGFVSRRSDWFPRKYMLPAIDAVLPQIVNFPTRIAYGGSMGGYGALKYGKALGAQKIFTFVPQFSLNPEVVGSFDSKFTEFFDADLHSGMELNPEEYPSEEAWVLFDPGLQIDAGHVEKIASVMPSAHFVKMPHTGHATAKIFAGTAKAKKLIETVVSGRQLDVKSLVAYERRKSSLRPSILWRAAFEKHPLWSAQIAAKHGDTFEAHDRVAMRSYMRLLAEKARSAIGGGRGSKNWWIAVLNAAESALALPSDDPLALLENARRLSKSGQIDLALIEVQKATLAAPKFANAFHMLAGFLMQADRYQEAVVAARRAADLDPDDHTMQLRHAIAADKAGFSEDAIQAAKRAISLSPKDAKLRSILGQFLRKAGLTSEALAVSQRAMEIDPENHIYRLQLARLLMETSCFFEAWEIISGVLAQDDDSIPALQLGAQVKQRIGQDLDALELLRKAIVADPGNPHVRTQMERLEQKINLKKAA